MQANKRGPSFLLGPRLNWGQSREHTSFEKGFQGTLCLYRFLFYAVF